MVISRIGFLSVNLLGFFFLRVRGPCQNSRRMSDRSRTPPGRPGIRGCFPSALQAIGVGELKLCARKGMGRLYFPAAWEPESSDEEVDQTEYTSDPLACPSGPLPPSTSEATRLVPRPKGIARICAFIFILIQANGCVEPSCECISGHDFTVKSSLESSSKG